MRFAPVLSPAWAAFRGRLLPFRLGRLRPVALLLLGFVLIDVGVRSAADTWERHSPDDYAERLRGCRREPREFVLVGGSPVSEGLDPAVVAGLRWRGAELRYGYAMGLPGGTTSDVYHAVVHGCEVPPRVLVYGIAPSDLNDARHEPHGMASLMTWGDLATWVRERPESAEYVARHFLKARLNDGWATFRDRHGVRMWAAATADDLIPGCCPQAAAEARQKLRYSAALRGGSGYTPAEWFVNRRYDQTKGVAALQPFDFLDRYRTGSHLKYLHKLADWAAAHGTALVLVDMPVTADLEAMYPAVMAEYRGRLAAFEAERRDVRVLRADRSAVGLGDEHFADTIHLNGTGAKVLSAWVRERVTALDGGTP